MPITAAALAFLASSMSGPAWSPPLAALEAGLAGAPPGPARAVLASGFLLGAPYVLSPLGEGAPPDADPRFRLDAFDCVTFVETAIALGHSTSLAEARALLDDVRYDGAPDFQHRNHYLEAQWLPANARKGWVEEATERVAGPAAARFVVHLDAGAWRAAERNGHVLPDLAPASRPHGEWSYALLPLSRLVELGPRIPEGTLLLVVREARPSRPYRVTHLGLVVAGPGGKRVVRHASDAPGAMRVRDEPLARFAARLERFRWPVAGVSLWALRDNSGRARELLNAPGTGARP